MSVAKISILFNINAPLLIEQYYCALMLYEVHVSNDFLEFGWANLCFST